MAIFFQCGCGQDLRADEAGAGGTKECPECGHFVPVPSLAVANHRLGIGSLPLLELPNRPAAPAVPSGSASSAAARLGPPRKAATAGWPGAAEMPVYPLRPDVEVNADDALRELERRQASELLERARHDLDALRRCAGGWRLETAWYQCLLYPVVWAWAVLLVLSGVWATLALTLVEQLPEEWNLAALWPRLPLLAAVFLLLGYTCAFFQCVLASAAAGECGFLRWPGADILQVLWCGAACLVCFLAGPIVAVVVAVLFWLNSGDLTWLDQLIIWELGLVAVGYWALALLAVDESGRLRAANPIAVARLARRLGWRGWVLTVLAAVGVLVHFHVTLLSREISHGAPALGWMLLGWWGLTGSAWVVFLLRWFGVSQFRARERQEREQSQAEEQRPPAARLEGARS